MRESTRAQYRSGFARWRTFCRRHGRDGLASTTTLGAYGRLAEAYVANLAGRVAPGTIASHLAAIRFFHLARRRPDPTDRCENHAVRMTLDGAARQHATPKVQKRALTLGMLRDIRLATAGTADEAAGDAVIVAAFAGLRGAEVGPQTRREYDPKRHLARKDARSDGQGRLSINISVSKRNDCAAAVIVGFRHADDLACPVSAVLRARRRASHKGGDAPLFQMQGGSAVTKRDLERVIKKAAQRAGWRADSVSPHSCRVTLVNLMLAANFTKEQVRRQGRWASTAAEDYERHPALAQNYERPRHPADVADVAGTLLQLVTKETV